MQRTGEIGGTIAKVTHDVVGKLNSGRKMKSKRHLRIFALTGTVLVILFSISGAWRGDSLRLILIAHCKPICSEQLLTIFYVSLPHTVSACLLVVL